MAEPITPSESEVHAVLQIVEGIIATPLPYVESTARLGPRLQRIADAGQGVQKTLLSSAVILLIGMVLSSLLFAWLGLDPLQPSVRFIGWALWVLSVPTGAIIVLQALPSVVEAFKSPLNLFLARLRHGVQDDWATATELASYSDAVLQYALHQLTMQRDAQEKRGNLLNGALDKLGLFPAMAGAAALWATMSKYGGVGSIAQIFIPTIMMFHLMNLQSNLALARVDRAISLLKAVLAMKK